LHPNSHQLPQDLSMLGDYSGLIELTNQNIIHEVRYVVFQMEMWHLSFWYPN